MGPNPKPSGLPTETDNVDETDQHQMEEIPVTPEPERRDILLNPGDKSPRLSNLSARDIDDNEEQHNAMDVDDIGNQDDSLKPMTSRKVGDHQKEENTDDEHQNEEDPQNRIETVAETEVMMEDINDLNAQIDAL